ncbi:MAG: hypothetical protein LIO62_04285, partial [Clostridiales bacterium]|nr:hypothetical protein [Clostridiales bacterium]
MKGKSIIQIICCFLFIAVFSISATEVVQSDTAITEGQEHITGEEYYSVQGDTYWFVTSGYWHQCQYNLSDSDSYNEFVEDLRNALYDRQSSFPSEYPVEYDGEGEAPDNFYPMSNPVISFVIDSSSVDDLDSYVQELLETVFEDAFDDDAPYGGDYLENMIVNESYTLGSYNSASSRSDYKFYYISYEFDYATSAAEEDAVNDFLTQWNEIYVNSNPTIQNATGERKEYYIVKTIYNYLCKNTVYDEDVYQGNITGSPEYDEENLDDAEEMRYRLAHTSYGALFANTDGAYNLDSFDYQSTVYNEIIGEEIYSMLDFYEDSQGLYRVIQRDNGRSVCDGYTYVFYYLCKLNGIDCRIVKGDYTDDRSDPHAWNTVELGGNWYYIDSTFASQNTVRITNELTIVDYDYFLRGTENTTFSEENHQTIYDGIVKVGTYSDGSDAYMDYTSKYDDVTPKSSADYRFEIDPIKSGKLYTILSRTIEENDEDSYNDYLIINPDNQICKVEADEDGNYTIIVTTEKFKYYGEERYYYCNLTDYAEEIEYTSTFLSPDGDEITGGCDNTVGDYSFKIYTSQGNDALYEDNEVVSITCPIAALDMSDRSNYAWDLTKYSDMAYYMGLDINVEAEIHDSSRALLTEGEDYIIRIYKAGDEEKGEEYAVVPKNPGQYIIRISYMGNYTGDLDLDFEVTKADMSSVQMTTIAATYGSDIISGCDELELGEVTLKVGTDFSVKLVGDLDYGDSGYVLYTALSGSEYLTAGTTYQRTYKIAYQYDLTNAFDGKSTGLKYTYTGSAIKPSDFTMSISLNGVTEKLVKGTDYTIKSYSNNTNYGTAYVTIGFIGNYKGTAKLSFEIVCSSFEFSVSNLYYTGKSQTPNPTVKFGGYTLTKGTDYTLSGSGTNPGVYALKVTGKGAYAGYTASKTYYILPAAVSSLKATTTSSSVKLSWASQGSTCAYQIYAYDSTKKTWKLIATTNSTSYTAKNIYTNGKKAAVSAGKSYSFKVRAYFNASVSGSSVTKYGSYSGVSAVTLPKTPTLSKVTVSSKKIKLTWKKDSAVTGYVIYISTDSSFSKNVTKKTIS